jgi:hypothetical protein
MAKNPFRSEAEAYRFVLGTVVYFVAIVLATAFGGRWVGIGVFVGLSLLVLFWFFRRETREAAPQTTPREHAPGERRILVIANETVAGMRLREEVQAAAREGGARVHVVSPALNSPVKHWVSDDDQARAKAQERLERSLAELGRLGIAATGEIGDSDPVQAIEDALRTFGADIVIISTHPEGKSNWLERGVVRTARERFAVPITHVVVDLSAEQA